MRVVLDSNVMIAAFAAQGLCHTLFEFCLANHTICISPALIKEVEEKLRLKIKVPAGTVKEIVDYVKKHAQTADPIPVPTGVCRDSDDAHVLGLAVAANCQCIVSGDQDLVILKEFQDIPILTPRQFHDFLQKD